MKENGIKKLPKKQAAATPKQSENTEQMKNPLAQIENSWVKVARKGNKKARVSTVKDITPTKKTLNIQSSLPARPTVVKKNDHKLNTRKDNRLFNRLPEEHE